MTKVRYDKEKQIAFLNLLDQIEKDHSEFIYNNELATFSIALLKESVRWPDGNDYGYFEEKLAAIKSKLTRLKRFRHAKENQ